MDLELAPVEDIAAELQRRKIEFVLFVESDRPLPTAGAHDVARPAVSQRCTRHRCRWCANRAPVKADGRPQGQARKAHAKGRVGPGLAPDSPRAARCPDAADAW